MTTENNDTGQLPSLDGKVLGAPKSNNKSKTNVGKFTILGIIVAGFIFIIIGLLIYQNKKSKTQSTAPVKEQKKPAFENKNKAVNSDFIKDMQEQIKKQLDDEKKRKDIEQAQSNNNPASPNTVATTDKYANTNPNTHITPRNYDAVADSNAQPTQPKIRKKTPTERALSSDVLLDVSGSNHKDKQDIPSVEGIKAISNNFSSSPNMDYQNPNHGGTTTDIASRLQPTILEARKAGKLPNLDFLLKKGTIIPCSLKNGIDTTLPGFVMCNVMSDVYSANGNVLLVERGSTVFGEQQSGLKQGQTRTFVVWSRIDTPKGYYFNIDSPATDQMGLSGISGEVNTHFWSRFGGAIMLSLIKDFSQSFAMRSSGNSNQPNYSNTTQVSQDMGAEALRNSINIPPTLTVNAGSAVNVLVARDISFENIYALIK